MELLTAQELAEKLRITVDTVWRYTRAGRIPCLKLGPRDYRYELPSVLDALSAREGSKLEQSEGKTKTDAEFRAVDLERLRVFTTEPPGDSP